MPRRPTGRTGGTLLRLSGLALPNSEDWAPMTVAWRPEFDPERGRSCWAAIYRLACGWAGQATVAEPAARPVDQGFESSPIRSTNLEPDVRLLEPGRREPRGLLAHEALRHNLSPALS